PKPTLVIFPKLEGISETNRLAYRLDIYAETPLYRADVYIDAQTGGLIFENSQIQHMNNVPDTGVGATLYNGQQSFTAELAGGSYRLRQTTSGNGIQTFDAGNGNYSNAVDVTSITTNFASNQDAVQVHWGTEQTYNYYFQKHGRNSYDDNGAILKSYVNFGSSIIPSAYWNGSVMTYHGASTSNTNEMVALDIIGHEITHGVVKHSASLIYNYQSGALNESFADIFGEMVENHAQQGTNDWLGGADVRSNGGFRSFSNPKSKNHPDTYLGQYWHTSSSGNFGVHKNSGVQNKWFYLLSEGGTGTNDNNYNYSVTGIGKIAAAEIAYRNLTVYLTPNSNFLDARAGAIQSAMDLNNDNASSPEVIATTAAWDAVGVVVTPSSDIIPPTIPLNLVSTYFTQYNIDLSWDASTDNISVLGYNIYKGSTKIGTSTSTNFSSGTILMPVNNVYDFTVAAFDAAGNVSGLSNIESVWIDTIKPSIPQNLISSNTTQTTTILSWDASTDNFTVAGYNIYKNNT
ncbi:Zinc metalloproteinase precursor / aureolysin, partial [hydrothermal vent metagenome]